MPFCITYNARIHCFPCKGWGSIRHIGTTQEETCPSCQGSGTPKDRSTLDAQLPPFPLQDDSVPQ
jgi:DnaJ-class molecular chaperone